MNYIEQINNFWAKSENEDLSTIDISTYFALLNYCNRLSWKNPFICHWDIVCQYSGTSKNSFYKAMNTLNDKNFIEFTKGERNKKQPKVVILKLKNNKGTTERTTKEQHEEQKGNLVKPKNHKPKNKVYTKDVHDCFNICLEEFTEKLRPKNNITWLDTIDKLNRIDDIPFKDIEKIVRLVRRDLFWNKNFLSITKLRKDNPDGVKYYNVFCENFKITQTSQLDQSCKGKFSDSEW